MRRATKPPGTDLVAAGASSSSHSQAGLVQSLRRTDEAAALRADLVIQHKTPDRLPPGPEPNNLFVLESDSGSSVPLLGSAGEQVMTVVQPPIMQVLFEACVADKTEFRPYIDGESGGLRYQKGNSHVSILHPDKVPLHLRNAFSDSDAIEIWARQGADGDMKRLDDMSWEVIALAVTAFYARTDGSNVDAPFPLLLDDYAEWRSIDPRKRSDEQRERVEDRIRLIADERRMQIYSDGTLYLPDPKTGRRVKTPVVTRGAILASARPYWLKGQIPLPMTDACPRPDGYIVRLDEWARKYVAVRAMLGVNLKRLALYNLQRQLWEKRIGWYLCFQLNNQCTKIRESKDENGKAVMTPQQPLVMETILNGAHVHWTKQAETNPGYVIKQALDALKTLHDDKIIGDYRCMDCPPGKEDGTDLPSHGRLEKWLKRRWLFLPGRIMARHQQAKREAKREAAALTRNGLVTTTQVSR